MTIQPPWTKELNLPKLKRLAWIIVCVINIPVQAQSPVGTVFNQKISSVELLADFEVFRTGLEKLHPGLYRYTSRNSMDSIFNQMKEQLGTDMSYGEFYRIVEAALAQIKCQHTVAIPESGTFYQITKTGQFFPLKLFWEFDPVKAYAIFDFSSEAKLPPGTRIISINGQTIEDIYAYLIPYFPSDGNILTNKHSRLQYATEFQLWYYLLINRPGRFVVELEKPDGGIYKKTYEAVTLKEIKTNYKKFRSRKEPDIKRYTQFYYAKDKKIRTKPIRYEYLTDEIALFTVGNFHSGNFEKIVTQAFTKFKEDNIHHLIIDLRYNGGGSDILGRHLFKHLIIEPTAYFDSLYTTTGISDTAFLFTHTNKDVGWYENNRPLVEQLPDGRFVTKPKANRGLLEQQPTPNNYEGDIYVLMNGRSASTTAEFTAATHFNKLAVFIGEESGGAYHGGNGGDFASLKLPNSKILIEIPLSRYVMNSSDSQFIGDGTLPDYEIQTTMQDFLKLKDPQLEFTLELISKKGQNRQ